MWSLENLLDSLLLFPSLSVTEHLANFKWFQCFLIHTSAMIGLWMICLKFAGEKITCLLMWIKTKMVAPSFLPDLQFPMLRLRNILWFETNIVGDLRIIIPWMSCVDGFCSHNYLASHVFKRYPWPLLYQVWS